MTQKRKSRPGTNRTAKISSGDDNSLPAPAAYFTDAAIYVAGAYVAVVHTAHEKRHRRVFLTLSSAQRAVDRAIEAGHDAEVVLCRLVPVTGGGSL